MDLRAEIAHLNRCDPERKVFGASEHQYELNDALTESKLGAFEAHHAIALPAEYRDYLSETGDGIAGPFYGVFRLDDIDDNNGMQLIGDCPLVGKLDQPFLHTTAWNLPRSELSWPDFADGTPLEQQEAIIEERDVRLDAIYWGGHIMNGCLPICHRGCALRVWLIITGPMAGTVWNDDRADDLGLYPVLDEESHAMTFARWMRTWLDDPIHHASSLASGGKPAS